MTNDDFLSALNNFNKRQGRLRLSITSLCQLSCRFCHKEGNENHGTHEFMAYEQYKKILNAYSELGGREVNITGGEPLLHPECTAFLEYSREKGFYTTLSTNGLLLGPWLKTGPLPMTDLVKVSMHCTDTEKGRLLLGSAWNYEAVKQGIAALKNAGYPVIINFTLGKSNSEYLMDIIKLSMEMPADLKIIDIGWTKNNQHYYEKRFVNTEPVRIYLDKIAITKKHITDKVGSILTEYRTSVNKILLRDTFADAFHTGMCDPCSYRSLCSEGVFALRINCSGTVIPCLLRDDLYSRLPDLQHGDFNDNTDFTRILLHSIYTMMTGKTD